MNLPISRRLLACADFVPRHSRVADVGCDHGYLSIYLLQNGIAESVIASDVNQLPLQSAVANAEKYGVREKITFCLSDGVSRIPRDFDTLVCAGMGADTMISILSSAPWLRSDRYQLILQCQSKTPALRKYLSDSGWYIAKESVLRDGRFLYTVMAVSFCPEAPRLTAGQTWFPPAILKDPTPETAQYYRRLLFSLRRAISGRGENADSQMVSALAQLEALAEDPDLAFLKEETL